MLNQYHQDFADHWDGLVNWPARAAAEGTFFEDVLREHECRKILDIACGTGFHAIKLMQAGFDVFATDASPEMIQKAQQNALNRQLSTDSFEVCSWQKLDNRFQAESFDAIICLGNSLTHIFDDNARKNILTKITSLVKHGGLVLIDQRNYDKILAQGFSSNHEYYYLGQNVEITPVTVTKGKIVLHYAFQDGFTADLNLCPIRSAKLNAQALQAGLINTAEEYDFGRRTAADADFIQHIYCRP